MEERNIFTPQHLYEDACKSFEMKLGGTTYEVSTHFDPEGRQSVLEQYMSLILKEHLV